MSLQHNSALLSTVEAVTCHDPAPCDVFVSRVSQYPTPALPLCTRSDSLEEDAVVKAKEDKRRGVRHKGSPGGDNLVPSSHPPLHPTLRSVPFDNEGEWVRGVVHSRGGGKLKQLSLSYLTPLGTIL